MSKMNIRKDDSVKILAGKEKGKSGKVLEVLPKENRVIVEGLNIHTRYSKPKRQGETGQKLELPGAMNVSKVMLVCPHCGVATRVAHEVNDSGNFRKCKQCGKLI